MLSKVMPKTHHNHFHNEVKSQHFPEEEEDSGGNSLHGPKKKKKETTNTDFKADLLKYMSYNSPIEGVQFSGFQYIHRYLQPSEQLIVEHFHHPINENSYGMYTLAVTHLPPLTSPPLALGNH